jgi:hypothetical protein
MQKLVSIVTAFAVLAILGFLTINWVSEVPAPGNVTSAEYNIYTNLTDTTEMAFIGMEAVTMLVVVAMIFTAFMVVYRWFL